MAPATLSAFAHTDTDFVRYKLERDGHAVVFAYEPSTRVNAVHSVGLTANGMPEVLLRLPDEPQDAVSLLRAFRAVDRVTRELLEDHGLARHGHRVTCASGTYLLAAGSDTDYDTAACAHEVYAGRLVEVLTMTLDLTEEI